ncbi:MAG: hypothetical protein JWQ11_1971 [Rhizobacter sp.]|nr:hypothetical protein [Rhizobacter sp.]
MNQARPSQQPFAVSGIDMHAARRPGRSIVDDGSCASCDLGSPGSSLIRAWPARWSWATVGTTAALLALLANLGGCGTTRSPGSQGSGVARSSGWDTDGPEANPPSNLMAVPDAEPKLEAIRNGGPNKPYNVLGRDYVPVVGDTPLVQRGLASWYGRKFHGQRTSSGEPYDMYAMTAAHATMPIPSYARVRNPANGREVIVRVNDRGPFHPDRILDLSYTAALKLGVLRGVTTVEVERITYEDIRAGTWMRPGDELRMASAAVSPAAAAAAAVGGAMAPPASGAPSPPPIESALIAPVAASMSYAGTATAAASLAPAPIRVEPSPATSDATGTASNGGAETFAVTSPTIATATSLAVATDAQPQPRSSMPLSAATPTAAAVAPAAPATSPALTRASPAFPRASPSPGFWVQLGAFGQRDGAEGFQRHVASELDWLAPVLAVFGDDRLYRLQAGPFVDREQAQGVARRVRQSMQLTPMIVDRR